MKSIRFSGMAVMVRVKRQIVHMLRRQFLNPPIELLFTSDVVPIRVAGVKSGTRRIHWDLCPARWHVVGSKMAMIEYCESRVV